MDRQIQPSYRGGSDLNRQNESRNVQTFVPRRRFIPPVCALCGSPSIKAFSSIYGHGTTFYTRIKGLIFKHGYERTKRQSVIAENCKPPSKVPWTPVFAVALAYAGTRWGAINIAKFAQQFEMGAYYLEWVGVLLAVIAAVVNWGFYPARRALWSRKFLCNTCGGCTVFDK